MMTMISKMNALRLSRFFFCRFGVFVTLSLMLSLHGAEPLHVVFMVGEQEYETARTLPEFARQELTPKGIVSSFAHVSKDDPNHFEGLEALADADVLFVSVRRRTPPEAQMQLIRTFLNRGGAVIGIRTSSHAFDREPPSADHVRWQSFDRDVLGGHYEGHYGNKPPIDPPSKISIQESKETHPVLKGIEQRSFLSTSHLYKNREMSAKATVLMDGVVVGREVREPVTWTHETSSGGRVVYTSLGNTGDFGIQPFRRLLLNAIHWVAGRAVPEQLIHPGLKGDFDPSASHNGWVPMNVPSAWEQHPNGAFADTDGFGWYRAYVHVPEAWRGSRLLLVVDEVSDVDEGFFNGIKIGANGAMPPLYQNPSSNIRRPFVIDTDWIRYGEDNLIAWRVYDKGGQGGILKGPVHLSRRDDAIDLQGTWLFRPGDAPSWSQWDHNPDSAEAKQASAQFKQIVGVGFAGHVGIVDADIGGRQRRIQEVYEKFKGNTNVHALTEGKGAPLPPDAALESLEVSDGLSIDLVLSEPLVKQPLYIDFDERGRMWVVQYIQYPNPAGLEVLTWDNHLRKVFDAVPPPPPYDRPEHQKFIGKDKITVHEDTDGDGVFDTHKTFLDGLNMCTSLAFDQEGIWVMHPPYLLFYPDRNHDDQPDGPPEVHLSGFGLEDTHSIANSLKWGPDGWLYGATGSTVTARVKVERGKSNKVYPFFGQNIWRYHPVTHHFELFAEGGWNTFGVDFDSKGRLYSGTNGNLQSVYFVQGGYYQKSFGKHGPHTNPYTFGHFFGLPIEGEKVRLVHQWVLYESGAIPSLENHFVGSNSLANKVHALRVMPDGSTFKTAEIESPVTTSDKWFRPVHNVIGPDGAIYLSDWYDARITHVDPRDNWDRERGRIYRLRDARRSPGYAMDMHLSTTEQLVSSLSDQNQWVRSTARRLLRQKKDPAAVALLQERLTNAEGATALEALWTLEQMQSLAESTRLLSLNHADPHVRLWGVRLSADVVPLLSSAVFKSVMHLAKTDSDPEVISQIAASAQRLRPSQGYPLVQALFQRDEWSSDPYIPQQIWWALESQIRQQPEGMLALLDTPDQWQFLLLRETLLSRLSRRLTSEQDPDSLTLCARLLMKAPDKDAVSLLLEGMESALQGSRLEVLPDALDKALKSVTARFGSDPSWVGFGLRIDSPSAFVSAREMVAHSQQTEGTRIAMISRLSELRDQPSVLIMLQLIGESHASESLKLAAMNGLRRFDDDAIAEALLDRLPQLEGDLLQTALSVMAGRTEWTVALLRAVDQGALAREAISFDVLITMQQRGDERIGSLIKSNWGNLRQPKAAITTRIHEVETTLKRLDGDARKGKELFAQICGACHVLHGEGRSIGPELTGYDRGNLDFLLPAVLDPNLAIREEFELVTLTLRAAEGEQEGALLTGFISGMEAGVLSLTDLAGNLTRIAETDVVKREHSTVSIMPEGLLDTMTEQQVADLFAYLQN